ncbi:RNA-directed DNA polymerase [Actinoplanes oblitus]|uniref:RNA-directed DNA polymerase n=1 Tax=Actinoplanes oblitus TaxID=3040509 RepID=A0ABY8WMS7_9ACTN|nr:RNA-directed DNA polymerase [Actinoplanes oblitus]WIM97634.1 RNA-directed DNA polymerase [Actinoplanes oblitus]
MGAIDRSAFDRAVVNVATRGDTDVFPFPVENHVLHDKTSEIVDLLVRISNNFRSALADSAVTSHSSLAPVGYAGYRWTTQIDPAWNAYLLGVVTSLAPAIEAARIDPEEKTVFSYRYDSDPANGLFEADGWRKFQERCLELAGRHQYVVSVDIADFYSRIYHHRLENALLEVDDSSHERTKQIISLLTKLSGGTSYGLPVGGNAARLLSELVLNRVDRLLLAESEAGEFCRYADDYRFFVNDIQSAHRCIGMLSEKLMRNEGFSLQKAKTRIFTSTEYDLVTEAQQQGSPGSASRFLGLRLHFDPYATTAVEDYERMMLQVSEFDILGMLRDEITKGRIHVSLTKRLVSALRYMDEESRSQAVVSLLENVETLAPIIPQVMLSVRQCLDEMTDEDAASDILRTVRGLIEDQHYVAKNDLNLAYIVRVLGARKTRENERMLIRLYGTAHGYGVESAPNIQRDILLIMAKWNARYWLSERKHSFGTDHLWVKRAFRVASYALSDEGRHWRQKNKPASDSFDEVVDKWASERFGQTGWSVPI